MHLYVLLSNPANMGSEEYRHFSGLKSLDADDVVSAEMFHRVSRWTWTEARFSAWSTRAEDARFFTLAIPALTGIAGSRLSWMHARRRGRSFLVSAGASCAVGMLAAYAGIAPMRATSRHLARQAEAYAIAARGAAIQTVKWKQVYGQWYDSKIVVPAKMREKSVVDAWDAIGDAARKEPHRK
jgi:hypothetical protein